MRRNLRGAYMTFAHDRAEDWQWLRDWQPTVVRLMVQGNHNDPNSVSVPLIERVHATCPDATILLRCWDVDDRNYEAHAAMVQDPKGEAARQVDWWAKLFDRIQGVPRHQLMAGLNNETGPEKDGALYGYTMRALALATTRQVRLGVFVFSVGRPALTGESQFDMAYFARLEPLILANNGAVVAHEYMQPEGMYAVWTDEQGNERKDYTYLIGRHTRWLLNVPIIIGEWSIDGLLYNRHPHPIYGNNGWHNFSEWPPTRYADEYVECIRQASDNVIGICPFLSDNGDSTGKWKSFDVLEAYGELLKRKELCVKEATPPHTIHLPSIEAPQPAPVEPMPATIIDPRVAQAILKIESGGHTHGEDGRPIIRFEAHIFKSQLGNDALWAQHFRTDSARPWVDQMWRRNESATWQPIHTGKQADEWEVFDFASLWDEEAACRSVSMGSAQIMGFNHARIGYPSAGKMLVSFEDAQLQTIGFINFCLSDPALMDAMRRRDWRTVAARYNGTGAVDTYSKLLQDAYNALVG